MESPLKTAPTFPRTYGRQLCHAAYIRPFQELGLAVVDVLHLDDELRLGLQGVARQPVQGLSPQGVEGLLLPVQTLRGVDVSRELVDDEDGPGAFAGDGVLDGSLALVRVGVDLEPDAHTVRECLHQSEWISAIGSTRDHFVGVDCCSKEPCHIFCNQQQKQSIYPLNEHHTLFYGKAILYSILNKFLMKAITLLC